MRSTALLFTACVLAAAVAVAGCKSSDKDGNNGKPDQADVTGFMGASDWRAWLNKEPPGPPKLIAVGKVQVASSKHAPLLVFDHLDKSNPPILHLRLLIDVQGEVGLPAVTTKDARFESLDAAKPKAIVIHYPNGKEHTITEIKVVQ